MIYEDEEYYNSLDTYERDYEDLQAFYEEEARKREAARLEIERKGDRFARHSLGDAFKEAFNK